jgi:hypothetical protein
VGRTVDLIPFDHTMNVAVPSERSASCFTTLSRGSAAPSKVTLDLTEASVGAVIRTRLAVGGRTAGAGGVGVDRVAWVVTGAVVSG